MHPIDEIRSALYRRHTMATAPLTLDEADPVVFTSNGSVWTLYMLESMWQYVVDQSHAEIFVRRRRRKPVDEDDIPF